MPRRPRVSTKAAIIRRLRARAAADRHEVGSGPRAPWMALLCGPIRDFGIRRLGLFGSVVRGEARVDSDSFARSWVPGFSGKPNMSPSTIDHE